MARREYERLYKQMERREFGIPARNFKKNRKWNPGPMVMFDALKVYEYFMRFKTEELTAENSSTPTYFINGYRVDERKARQLNRWKNGESKKVELAAVDAMSVAFNLPLWEIEEVAKISP